MNYWLSKLIKLDMLIMPDLWPSNEKQLLHSEIQHCLKGLNFKNATVLEYIFSFKKSIQLLRNAIGSLDVSNQNQLKLVTSLLNLAYAALTFDFIGTCQETVAQSLNTFLLFSCQNYNYLALGTCNICFERMNPQMIKPLSRYQHHGDHYLLQQLIMIRFWIYFSIYMKYCRRDHVNGFFPV